VSPLVVAVVAIVAFFGIAAVARFLRVSLEHRRRPRPPGRRRSKRPDHTA